MKAILFAAGRGRRLKAVSKNGPKCLLEIGGRSLLSRSLAHLNDMGVKQVVVVVGFSRHAIYRALAADPYPGEVHCVVNEQFGRGNILSLWAARSEMDGDLLLMDSDVLYSSETLRRLVHSPYPTAVLMDETVRQKTEECMVTGRDGMATTLSKSLPAHPGEMGETVGFIKVHERDIPAMLHSVRSCVEAGRFDMEYEDALEMFIKSGVVGYEKIGGLPWIEIDFPDDVTRAAHVVLPSIESLDGAHPGNPPAALSGIDAIGT